MEELSKDPVFDSFSESNSREGSLRAGAHYPKVSQAVARLLACPEDAAAQGDTLRNGGYLGTHNGSSQIDRENLGFLLTHLPAQEGLARLNMFIKRHLVECWYLFILGLHAHTCIAGAKHEVLGLSTADIARRACEAQNSPPQLSASPG